MKIKFIFFIFSVVTFQAIAQHDSFEKIPDPKKGLIKIAIMYPNGESHNFDMDYYAEKHMPMVANLFGEPLKGYGIEKGIAGRTPDEPVPFLAVGYFYFEKLSEYEAAFGANAEKILGDIPNYTNIQPTVLISEVVR